MHDGVSKPEVMLYESRWNSLQELARHTKALRITWNLGPVGVYCMANFNVETRDQHEVMCLNTNNLIRLESPFCRIWNIGIVDRVDPGTRARLTETVRLRPPLMSQMEFERAKT